MYRSFGSFIDFLLDKSIKRTEVISQILPPGPVEMHFKGDIHIHKLPYSLWIPYCIGWSYAKILLKGLNTPAVISKPAKSFQEAFSQLVNFFFLAAQEWTGAQAVSALDLFQAPFVKSSKLKRAQLKDILRMMFFELNYPSRMGFQSPFTNITLMMDLNRSLLEEAAIVGGKVKGLLGDYLDEALLLDEVLFEIYTEGDDRGQPFTFPILTMIVSKNFDWNGRRWGELTELIFRNLSERGSAYILNGYVTNFESLYAMCCRLTIDVSKLKETLPIELQTLKGFYQTEDFGKRLRCRGIWALPDATGSIGVVTINLPRLSVLSKGEWNVFEELLSEKVSAAREVLLRWRERYEKSLKEGFMPITLQYLGTLSNHFNTVGVVGLPEAAANFMREPKLWAEGSFKSMLEAAAIMKRMIRCIRERVEEFEEMDGFLYNIEEVPAESTAYRLARMDYSLFKEDVKRGDVFIPSHNGVPFYSNNIVPYYADVSIPDRVRIEGDVQQEFTGGVMMHLFLAERPDPKALKNLVYRIATNSKVVYFSITPTISVCRSCGWNAIGVYDRCPKCGSEAVDVWSRIVGYYKPIRMWNIGRLADFRTRKTYTI